MQYVGTIRVLTAFSVRDVVATQTTSRHLVLRSSALLKLVYSLPQLCCILEDMIQTIITRLTVHD
jgi:hypothetical protein